MIREIFRDYALNSTTYRFVKTTDPIRGTGFIKTVGNVVATTRVGTGEPFGPLVVGDEIIVIKYAPRPETVLRRKVATKTNGHDITVDSAWDLSVTSTHLGYPFDFRKISDSAATVDDGGWIDCEDMYDKSVKLELTALDGTSVEFTIQGRGSGDSSVVPVELLGGQFTAAVVSGTPNAAAAGVFPIPEYIASIRVGVKGTGGNNKGTISAYLFGHSHLAR